MRNTTKKNTDKSEPVFFTKDRTCFSYHKKMHIAKFCRVQRQEPNNGKYRRKITSLNAKKLEVLPKMVSITRSLNRMQ